MTWSVGSDTPAIKRKLFLLKISHSTAKQFVHLYNRNKKKACLKAKIEDLETNNKIKNIRDLYTGISDFKKGYQPRTNIVKDETGLFGHRPLQYFG